MSNQPPPPPPPEIRPCQVCGGHGRCFICGGAGCTNCGLTGRCGGCGGSGMIIIYR